MSMIRFKVDRETGTRTPQQGCPIYTADGAWLGEVAEVRDQYVKIDAPLERDFWIRVADLTGEFSDGLSVGFVEEDAGAYLLGDDDVARRQPETSAAAGPVILSDEEQQEQRERMARELAEQRADLPHRHSGGQDTPPDTRGSLGTYGEPVESELARRQGQSVESVVRDVAEAEEPPFGETGARVRDANEPMPAPSASERIGAVDAPGPPRSERYPGPLPERQVEEERGKRLGMITGVAGLMGVVLFGLWWVRSRRA